MSARPIGEIAQEIVDEIAENCALCGVSQFTLTPDSATDFGPQTLRQQREALTCNANEERRS